MTDTKSAKAGAMILVDLIELSFARQICELVPDRDKFYEEHPRLKQPENPEDFEVFWTWERIEGAGLCFTVELELESHPSSKREEFIAVRCVGRFRIDPKTTLEALRAFAQYGAPHIIYPYLRQRMSELTLHSPLGTQLTSVVNIKRLMDQFTDAAELPGWSQFEQDDFETPD